MKRPTKDSLESDVVYARHIYCYTDNNPKLVKYTKRKMNKRLRKEKKFDIQRIEKLFCGELIIDGEVVYV